MPHKQPYNGQAPVVIVGAGIAGLTAALRLAPRPVLLIANAPMGEGVASGWSQGGIAAALSQGDSPESHQHDTLVAAAGTADLDAVRIITEEAKEAIDFLTQCGVAFDHHADGNFALSKEAAHSHARIVRVAGDLTGPGIMAGLRKAVAKTPSIMVRAGFQALQLTVDQNHVTGLWIASTETQQLEFVAANAVILATGGAGYLYRNTSNPPTACGEGIAIAARAGAILADLEFMQFHPTTLAVGRDPSPLATEALRGEGAILINEDGKRFMVDIHKDAELAPRDIVARAIFREYLAGHRAYLDCTQAIGKDFAHKFPKVFALCQEAGIDPSITPIPVEPAAHYHMGGVATDSEAKTSIDGLWACGEVGSTGAHGANRLASNSLLEAVVFAKRAAKSVERYIASAAPPPFAAPSPPPDLYPHDARNKQMELILRETMRDFVGVIRERAGMEKAIAVLTMLEQEPKLSARLSNMLLVSKMIALYALWREESRGSHFRLDFPDALDAWKKRQFYMLADCENWLRQKSNTPSAKKVSI